MNPRFWNSVGVRFVQQTGPLGRVGMAARSGSIWWIDSRELDCLESLSVDEVRDLLRSRYSSDPIVD